jgi:hypothetical protein
MTREQSAPDTHGDDSGRQPTQDGPAEIIFVTLFGLFAVGVPIACCMLLFGLFGSFGYFG